MLKSSESHCGEVNTLGILVCDFSTFLRFLKRIHLRKSLTESGRSILAKKISKNNWYSGSSSLSNAWRFLTHVVEV